MVDMSMSDTLISFETAKLGKEKGFNLKTPKYYTTENPHSFHKDIDGVCILGLIHSKTLYEPQNEIDKETGISKYKLNPSIIYAPTQSLLQKWLREEHNIHIEVWKMSGHFRARRFEEFTEKINFDGNIKDVIRHHKYSNYLDGDTYEETLEKGLYQALKLIK